MSNEQGGAERHFQPGSTRLSRTAKAELGETGTLTLETEDDYLELSAEETRQLADFLHHASVYSKLEERLARLSAHLQRGEASPKAVEALLFELMLSLVPGPLLREMTAVLTLAGQKEVEARKK